MCNLPVSITTELSDGSKSELQGSYLASGDNSRSGRSRGPSLRSPKFGSIFESDNRPSGVSIEETASVLTPGHCVRINRYRETDLKWPNWSWF